MNIIEKRKSQFKFVSAIILAIAVILSVIGVILIMSCGLGNDLSVVKLVFGIVLFVIGLFGIGLGVFLSIMTSSVKATKGSIAEDNAGKGTVNMHKCKNCGTEVEKGKTFCEKCEENLKP